MCKKTLVAVCVLCLATGMIQAAQVDLQALGINAGFDDWLTVGNEGSRWASEQTGNDLNGDGVNDLYDAVLTDDEYYTNPSSFGSGWQSNGTAGLNGKYGLQHPKRSTQNDMSAPFNGDFIGFVNLDDGDGLSQSIQSGIVGALVEGTYTLTVAVGVRPSTSWNDVRYEIALVADPVLGPPDNNGPALGSRDGTVLGVPATVTLVPSTAVLGASNQDLVYTLTVEANDLNLGKPFAIRIGAFNALQQNGVPDDGTNNGAVAPGTNYRFVQGNFDNIRLDVVQTIDLQALGINAGFDDWLTVGNEGSKWASEQTGNDLNGDGVNDLYDAVLTDDEYYTNPSSFGSGWQSNGAAGLTGKYGLQHPKRSTQNDMSAPFNGDFIGFVNLDDGDGLSQSIQSGIVGALVEGTYTLTVAVGVRPSTSWNDVRYEIALVADPVLGPPDNNGPALGSRDGTVLGVPATVTLVPSTAVLGASNQDLVYTLTVEANDLNLGKPFAIRIDVFNALQQNGVPDDGTNNGAVAPGTNYRFVQGNFDNVRLAIASKTLPVPEPVEKDEPLVNGSFEEPAGGQVGFDNVPGWATDTPAANSGIKVDPNTTDGAQAAYLGGGDPAVRQLSSLVVEAGSTLRLSVDARSAVGAADLKITLFIELAGVRAAVVTRVLTLTESMAGYVLLVEDPSALVGLAVGVELANVGGPDTSLVLDNVTLR